jgi:hypothetical protein
MTGEVHGIADWRAARQRITVAGGPDLSINTLGQAQIESPLAALRNARKTTEHYVDEDDRVLLDDTLGMVWTRGGSISALPSFEPAGPDTKSSSTRPRSRVGIVTRGGLCPGLNGVIRGLVRNLTYPLRDPASHRLPQRLPGFHRHLSARRDGLDTAERS